MEEGALLFSGMMSPGGKVLQRGGCEKVVDPKNSVGKEEEVGRCSSAPRLSEQNEELQHQEEQFQAEEKFLLTQITGTQFAATAVCAWLLASYQKQEPAPKLPSNRPDTGGGSTDWMYTALFVFVVLQLLTTLFCSYFWGRGPAEQDRFLAEGAFGAEKDTIIGLALLYSVIWVFVFWRLGNSVLGSFRRFLVGYLLFLVFLLVWLFFY